MHNTLAMDHTSQCEHTTGNYFVSEKANSCMTERIGIKTLLWNVRFAFSVNYKATSMKHHAGLRPIIV